MRLGLKLRTDFVTNSSSSSFIFSKNTDLKELEKRVNKKAIDLIEQSKTCTDKFEKYGLERSAVEIKMIVSHLITPDELEIDDLLEVLSWYICDICEEICKSKDMNNLDETDMNMVFTDVLTDLICDVLYGGDYSPDRLEELAICDLFSSHNNDHNVLDVISNNFEKWVEFVNRYKDTPGKMLDDVLDCKYLYFDSDETYYLAVEILSEMEECVYSCGHMG